MLKVLEALPLELLSKEEKKADLPVLMRFRVTVTWDNFIHSFFSNPQNHQTYPYLNLFIQRHETLCLVRHLHPILHWQDLMFKKFNRRLSKQNEVTFDELVESSFLAEKEKQTWHSAFKELKRSWNRFIVEFKETTKEELRIENSCMPVKLKKISAKRTPVIDTLMTSATANPAVAIIQFLLRTQNRFLVACCHLKKDQHCSNYCSVVDLPSIPLHLVVPDNLISYDPSEFLFHDINLVVDQMLEYGKGKNYRYKVDNLEQFITQKHIEGKPMIHLISRMFEFKEGIQQDILPKLSARVKQQELSQDIKDKVLKELSSDNKLARMSDLLELCIAFLQKTGATPTTKLSHYMEETLLYNFSVTNNHSGHDSGTNEELFLLAKEEILLMHVHSLYSAINEELKDPFEDLDDMYKAPLPNELLQWLTRLTPNLQLEAIYPAVKAGCVRYLPMMTNVDEKLAEYVAMMLEAAKVDLVTVGFGDYESFPDTWLIKHTVATILFWKKELKRR